jgi:hypothetical protein
MASNRLLLTLLCAAAAFGAAAVEDEAHCVSASAGGGAAFGAEGGDEGSLLSVKLSVGAEVQALEAQWQARHAARTHLGAKKPAPAPTKYQCWCWYGAYIHCDDPDGDYWSCGGNTQCKQNQPGKGTTYCA